MHKPEKTSNDQHTSAGLSAINVIKKNGNEPFEFNKKPTGIVLLDFWKWAYSDLVGNTERGILSEFIIATALGVDIDV